MTKNILISIWTPQKNQGIFKSLSSTRPFWPPIFNGSSGFTFLEIGLTRQKNSINILFKNFFVITALVYWTLELIKYDKKGDEKKDVTAHSFL